VSSVECSPKDSTARRIGFQYNVDQGVLAEAKLFITNLCVSVVSATQELMNDTCSPKYRRFISSSSDHLREIV